MTEQEIVLLLTVARIMRNDINEANLAETRDPEVFKAAGIGPEEIRKEMIRKRAYHVRELDAAIRPFIGRRNVDSPTGLARQIRAIEENELARSAVKEAA